MAFGVGFNSRQCLGYIMSGLVRGLDVDSGWCEAFVIDLFGNIVVSRRFQRMRYYLSYLR